MTSPAPTLLALLDAAAPGRITTLSRALAWHTVAGALLQAPGWEGQFSHWRLYHPQGHGLLARLHYPDPSDADRWIPHPALEWIERDERLPFGDPAESQDPAMRMHFDRVWEDPAWAWLGKAQGMSAAQAWERSAAWRAGGQGAPPPSDLAWAVSPALSSHELLDRLRERLGEGAVLRSGKDLGWLYHDIPNEFCRAKEDPQWRFFLATSERAVLGVAGVLERPESIGLSYITTGMPYRGRGVSGDLMRAVLAYADQQRKVLTRTRPGRMAEDNPGITQHYDRLIAQASVPHCYGDDRLAWLLEAHQPLAQPDEWRGAIKAFCDAHLVRQRELERVAGRPMGSLGLDWQRDEHTVQQWRDLLASLERQRALTAQLPLNPTTPRLRI